MRLPLALLMALAATPAAADVLVVDGKVALRQTTQELPRRGSTMTNVEAKFGTPRARHAAVGEPPITRWDYDTFSVYFEFQHVVHTVAHDAPPAPAGAPAPAPAANP
jgi:hypothetical protein